ncbi:MAG TPA: ABC transporter permease [Vicinamibacterales bacterium]|nr:ABC transporter permease [Vicinamibacterales bacterium]
MRISQAFGFWRHRPVAAAWIVATLGAGIGGALVLTSLCFRVLSPRLPMRDDDRVVSVEQFGANGWSGGFFVVDEHLDEYATWRARQHVFPVSTAFSVDYPTYARVSDDLQLVRVLRVTKDFFDVTGTRPERGRLLEFPRDVGTNVALISDEAARTLFGTISGALGRSIDLRNLSAGAVTPVTIVGILPPGFRVAPFVRGPGWSDASPVGDVVLPMSDGPLPANAAKLAPSTRRVLARLPPRMSPATAATQLQQQGGSRFVVTPLRRVLFGRTADVSRIVQWGAVALGLLALINAFGVVIAVEIDRGGEVATRRALGATPGQLWRQWWLEGAVITTAAVMTGMALAELAMRLIARIPALAVLELGRMTIGGREVAVTLSLAALFWFGRMAICRGVHSRQRPYAAETAPTVSRRTRVYRAALVGLQVGMALALLLGTEVATSSAARLLRMNLGFDPTGVLTAEVQVPDGLDQSDRYQAYLRGLEQAALDAPGLRTVGLATESPLFQFWSRLIIPVRPSAPNRPVGYEAVTPGYFPALGVRAVAGHTLGANDPPDAIVVNDLLATTYFGGATRAVGQLVTYGVGLPPARIVGVVPTLQQTAVTTTPEPTIYSSLTGSGPDLQGAVVYVVTRERGNAAAARQPLLSAIRRAAPGQYVNVTPLSDRFWHQTAATNAGTAILVGFAVFALALMAVGLHGVLVQLGASRAREFAMRQALGATPGHVAALMLTSVLPPVLVGVAGGAAAGIWTTRVLEHVFPDASGASLPVYVGAVVVIAVVALISSWGPARRAGRVDIVRELRAL